MKKPLLAVGTVLVLLGAGLSVGSLLGKKGTGQLELTLITKPTLMTAAYKVYGSGDYAQGKYWLGKVKLTNTGSAPISDLKVSFQIPEYINWTTPESFAELLPGQTIVLPYYPKLPSKVAQITSMTPTSLETKIEYDDGSGNKSRIEKREIQFRGVREIEYSSVPSSEITSWYDANDNAELNCAWVTEEDPAVRAFYTKVSEKAGGFGTMGNAKDLEQLARSTYNYMVATGMTYSGTKGVAEKKGDDWVLVQSMRMPRDLIYGNSGLCVELAILWASIAMNSGADCYLVMIPGHCFPVLKAGDGSILPIEATGVGGGFEGGNLGAPMTFEQAVEVATKNLQKIQSGEGPGMMFSVQEYRNQGIRPPELADIDRPALIKMLDERLANHQNQQPPVNNNVPVVQNGGDNGGQNINPNPNPVPNPVPNPNPNPNPGPGGNAWQDPTGRVAITLPQNWQPNPAVVQQMQPLFPGYVLSAANPMTMCGVDIIFFDGARSVNDVVNATGNAYQQLGIQPNFTQPQQTQVGGRAGQMVGIQAMTQNGAIAGVMNIVQVRGGYVAISFGGPAQNLQGAMPEMQAVLNTVRLGQ